MVGLRVAWAGGPSTRTFSVFHSLDTCLGGMSIILEYTLPIGAATTWMAQIARGGYNPRGAESGRNCFKVPKVA